MTLLDDVTTHLAAVQQAQYALGQPDERAAAAQQIAGLARNLGAASLVGASSHGLVLAGAAAAAAGLPASSPAGAHGCVLLVESVLVTGAQAAVTLAALAPGCGPVVLVAAAGPATPPPWLERAVDKVIVLNVLDALTEDNGPAF